jgi:predicted phosphate transport protein (TIGR00153 family)
MNFFRKKADFYALLMSQAEKVLEGVRALREYASHQGPERARKVRDLEKEADEERRVLIAELNRTFATPIDREDIFQLSRALDDVMDYADNTVRELSAYELSTDEHTKIMIEIMIQAYEELVKSIKYLKQYPKIANDHAVRAKKLENDMEQAYHKALADLFKGTDPIYMLKMREIYRHLSNCADRGDEAANIILSIVMKST